MNNPHNFIPHDRLSKSDGKPNKPLIAYNARRYQLNQLACKHETMPINSLDGMVAWYRLGRVIARLQRIHMGVAVTAPHWSELITVKGTE